VSPVPRTPFATIAVAESAFDDLRSRYELALLGEANFLRDVYDALAVIDVPADHADAKGEIMGRLAERDAELRLILERLRAR